MNTANNSEQQQRAAKAAGSVSERRCTTPKASQNIKGLRRQQASPSYSDDYGSPGHDSGFNKGGITYPTVQLLQRVLQATHLLLVHRNKRLHLLGVRDEALVVRRIHVHQPLL